MIKSYTKIVGTPVLVDSIRPITTVKDLVLDPETGKVLAFVVNVNKKQIITALDVVTWHEIIKIHDHGDIIDAAEVLRVVEVLSSGRFFYKVKVFSKDGEYLGRVLDFALNTKSFQLESIFVAKSVMGLVRYGSRVIASKDIEDMSRRLTISLISLDKTSILAPYFLLRNFIRVKVC